MGALAIHKDYLLSEAFELLGKYLYGGEWTDEEYRQDKVLSPDEIRNMREPHEHELREIEDQITNLNDDIAKTTSAKRTGTLRKRKAALEDKRERLHGALYQMPLCNEFTEAPFRTYERRQKIEYMIVDALRNGVLKAHNGRGEPIHSLVWSGSPGFGYYFELSMARMPRSASPPRRRELVRITEESFDEWIRGKQPLFRSAVAKPSPEEQCRVWLKAIFRTPDPDEIRKAKLKEKASRDYGLSGRKFDTIWSAEAPPTFKRGGRRHGKKSPRP